MWGPDPTEELPGSQINDPDTIVRESAEHIRQRARAIPVCAFPGELRDLGSGPSSGGSPWVGPSYSHYPLLRGMGRYQYGISQ